MSTGGPYSSWFFERRWFFEKSQYAYNQSCTQRLEPKPVPECRREFPSPYSKSALPDEDLDLHTECNQSRKRLARENDKDQNESPVKKECHGLAPSPYSESALSCGAPHLHIAYDQSRKRLARENDKDQNESPAKKECYGLRP